MKSFMSFPKRALGLLIVSAFVLVVCEDNTATSTLVAIPSAAAAVGSTTTSAAPVLSGQNGPSAGAGGMGQFNFGPPITGTISSYDATAKVLTVNDNNGQSQKLGAGNAIITTRTKLSQDDFAKALGNNAQVLVMGDKASDGSYSATSLTLVDAAMLGSNGAGMIMPANFTPPAGTTMPQGFPTMGAGGNGPTLIRSGNLSGNKLVGQNLSGQNVTVNISNTTIFNKQNIGSADDLKTGVAVSISTQFAQNGGQSEARLITISS